MLLSTSIWTKRVKIKHEDWSKPQPEVRVVEAEKRFVTAIANALAGGRGPSHRQNHLSLAVPPAPPSSYGWGISGLHSLEWEFPNATVIFYAFFSLYPTIIPHLRLHLIQYNQDQNITLWVWSKSRYRFRSCSRLYFTGYTARDIFVKHSLASTFFSRYSAGLEKIVAGINDEQKCRWWCISMS